MTMPSKIWATHFTGSRTEGKFSIYNLNAYGPHTVYIRADLAEELARALEHYDDGRAPVVAAALAKYKDATK